MKTRMWMRALTVGGMMLTGCFAQADELAIQSFESTGRLKFNALHDGINYNYQVEWAPSAAGPWCPLAKVGAWVDNIAAEQGSIVTSSVPMCYRIVATRGDYLVVDLSGGTNAAEYPVSYYGPSGNSV